MTKAAVDKRWALQNWSDLTWHSAPYADYTNDGSATQNPLTDFYGGFTSGTIFADMKSASNKLFADRTISGGGDEYTDSLALLKPSVLSLPLNHFVQTTLHLSGSSTGTNEHEHLLRGKVNFSLYEVIWQRGGTGLQFIHQTGAKPGFTAMDGSGGTPAPAGSDYAVAPANGDVLRSEVINNVGSSQIELRTYKALAASPTSFVAGPYILIPYANAYAIQDGYLAGIGAYVATGNTPNQYCASAVKIGRL